MNQISNLESLEIDSIDIYTDGSCKSNAINSQQVNLGTKIGLGVYIPPTSERQDFRIVLKINLQAQEQNWELSSSIRIPTT